MPTAKYFGLAAKIICLPHGCANTNIRSDSREDQVLDLLLLQDQIQICRHEGAFARLVNDLLHWMTIMKSELQPLNR